MDDYKQSVMVALRPITDDWARVPLPHLTLAFAGERSDLKASDFNELAKTAADIAMKHRPIQLAVTEMDVYSKEPEQVDVLCLRATPELMEMRLRVADWDVSNYPFKPHVTVGPRGSVALIPGGIPPAIAFDRILVSWGEEQLNFWLKP